MVIVVRPITTHNAHTTPHCFKTCYKQTEFYESHFFSKQCLHRDVVMQAYRRWSVSYALDRVAQSQHRLGFIPKLTRFEEQSMKREPKKSCFSVIFVQDPLKEVLPTQGVFHTKIRRNYDFSKWQPTYPHRCHLQICSFFMPYSMNLIDLGSNRLSDPVYYA